MSNYKFGQFRATQVSNYLKTLKYKLQDNLTTAPFSQAIQFKDKVIELNGTGNILESTDNTRTKSRSYFIQYKIYKQVDNEQIIDVKLTNTNKQSDNIQELKTIRVPQGNPTEFVTFDLVISPNSTYNQINFILNRISKDYSIENSDGTYGRDINMEINHFDEIINIIDTYLSSEIENKKILKQIGIQGPPGMVMCIDGEEIRIGRSGIYEINNGINISFLGFIIHDNDKYFILDYQY